MSNFNSILVIALICFIIGLFGGMSLKCCGKLNTPQQITIHDSVTVHDTAYIEAHTKPIYIVKHDTLWVSISNIGLDSDEDLCNCDLTIPVDIPITAYEYRDTFKTDSSNIKLGVYYSGYDTKIDSIDLQYKFDIQPVTVEKKTDWRFAVGPSIQLGYGIAFGNHVITAPYVGIGVSLSWGYTFKK